MSGGGVTFRKASPSSRDTRGRLGSLVRDFERGVLSPWTTSDTGERYPKLLSGYGSCICDPDHRILETWWLVSTFPGGAGSSWGRRLEERPKWCHFLWVAEGFQRGREDAKGEFTSARRMVSST